MAITRFEQCRIDFKGVNEQKIQIKCNITSKTMKNRKIKGCRQIFIKSQTLQTLDFIRFMEGYMMF